MNKLIIALAAVALLGGCMKVSNAPPKDLPAYVTVYPDAAQVVSMSAGVMSAVAFQASAKPDDVIAFYRRQAQADGLPETQAPPQAGAPADQRQAVFGDPAGDRMLVVVARPRGEGSMVSLTYKPAPKAPS
jgi:hypothetical protein